MDYGKFYAFQKYLFLYIRKCYPKHVFYNLKKMMIIFIPFQIEWEVRKKIQGNQEPKIGKRRVTRHHGKVVGSTIPLGPSTAGFWDSPVRVLPLTCFCSVSPHVWLAQFLCLLSLSFPWFPASALLIIICQIHSYLILYSLTLPHALCLCMHSASMPLICLFSSSFFFLFLFSSTSLSYFVLSFFFYSPFPSFSL